jgi:hypothetical protein
MTLFSHSNTDTPSSQPSLRRRLARLAAPALIALSIAGSVIFPQAQAQAAGKPDLDVISCSIVEDPIDWGDGIDWSYMRVRFTNKGTVATGPFKALTQYTYGKDVLSGQTQNEARVVGNYPSLKPGQVYETHYSITKNMVDTKQYGIFLDNNGFNQGTVSELVESNNHCTAWVNP